MATQVTFDGAAAATVGGSDTSITVTTPAHPSGAVDVVVTNPDGQTARLVNGFTYQAGPVISSVTPNRGPSAGGTSVAIAGSGFGGPGTTVTIGGITVAHGGSPTELTVTTPPHPAGSVDIVVTNPDGQQATSTNAFTYRDGPTISAVAPNQGPTAGGTTVKVSGTGFDLGTTITFDGTAATFVSGSSTGYTVRAPAHAAGSVDVVATNGDGQQATLTDGFTYQAAPKIETVSPATGTTLGGTAVTITGTGFGGPGAAVSFGGLDAPITSGSPTSLTVTTPAHTAGAVDIVVTTGDGQTATRVDGFTYVASAPAPRLASIKPTSGTTAGGVKVTLIGTAFRVGMVVRFGGVEATSVVVVSDTKATVKTPPHTAGVVDVVVTDTQDQSSTLPASFTYKAPRRA
jgi:predicted cupin superfamily sugar epimerase